MIDSTAPDALLPRTLSSDVGSVESRAAARMLLARQPVFITIYMRPNRNELGELGSPIECDSVTADVNGATVTRAPGESYQDFKQRCIESVPCLVFGFVRMNGDGES